MAVILSLKKAFPASTPSTAPLRDERTVQRTWFLKEIRLHVPSGHVRLVPVWFEKDNTRIVPTDSQEIRVDNVPDMVLPVGLHIDRDGTFALVGYNEDTSFEHTTSAIAVFLLPGEEGYPSTNGR